VLPGDRHPQTDADPLKQFLLAYDGVIFFLGCFDFAAKNKKKT